MSNYDNIDEFSENKLITFVEILQFGIFLSDIPYRGGVSNAEY